MTTKAQGVGLFKLASQSLTSLWSFMRGQKMQPQILDIIPPGMSRKRSRKKLKPALSPSSKSDKTVEINIAFPELSSLKSASANVFKTVSRHRFACGLLASVAGIFMVYNFLIQPRLNGSDVKGAHITTQLIRGTPDYNTITPGGVDADDLEWARVSPPETNPVYAFVDTLDNVQINVSEQPLPENFRDDTASRVEQLAKDFNASEKITVDNTTVYIGSSSSGPQSVIFAKDGLLVLIKSVTHISSNKWASYVNSLK